MLWNGYPERWKRVLTGLVLFTDLFKSESHGEASAESPAPSPHPPRDAPGPEGLEGTCYMEHLRDTHDLKQQVAWSLGLDNM